MNSLKKEIERIISSEPVDLELLNDEQTNYVVSKIYDSFINDNPRALWEGFKYTPVSVDTDDDYPYLRLPSLVSDKEDLFLVIDSFNEEYHVLRGRISSIMMFIEDCEGLDEYYLVNMDYSVIICENDHDQLLYVDISENE